MDPNSPYVSPREIGNDPESAAEIEKKMKFWKRAFRIILALVATPFLIGVLIVVYNTSKTFSHMGETGIRNPNTLAAHIGETIIAFACGLVLAIPGFVFLIISNLKFRSYRAKFRKFPT